MIRRLDITLYTSMIREEAVMAPVLTQFTLDPEGRIEEVYATLRDPDGILTGTDADGTHWALRSRDIACVSIVETDPGPTYQPPALAECWRDMADAVASSASRGDSTAASQSVPAGSPS